MRAGEGISSRSPEAAFASYAPVCFTAQSPRLTSEKLPTDGPYKSRMESVMSIIANIVQSGRAARVMLEAAVLSIAAGGGLSAAVLINRLLPL